MVESLSWPAKSTSYKLLTPIGQGSFGLVWKAECIEGGYSGKQVAIKVVDLELFQDNSIEEIRKEISIMSTC
jgi:serine/threonine protein kinase